MSVIETTLPASSLLRHRVQGNDFMDCYAAMTDRDLMDFAQKALSMPFWVNALMGLHGIMVKPFGLKHQKSPNPSVGYFEIDTRTEDELILGSNDKHLDFRISVLKQDGRAYVATWVHPHNWFGRLYLQIVLPFHRLIVRDAVKRGAQS